MGTHRIIKSLDLAINMPYIIKLQDREISIPKFSELTWDNILGKPDTWSWSAISGKPSTYPPSSHTHDDRYYTESEVTTKLNAKQNTLTDTGWANCTYGYAISRYSSTQAPLQVRRWGNVVHLRGVITNSTTWTTHNSAFTIPSGYNPSQQEIFVCQGSSSNRFTLYVNTSGVCEISRYSNNTTGSNTVPTGAWLCVFATWFIY